MHRSEHVKHHLLRPHWKIEKYVVSPANNKTIFTVNLCEQQQIIDTSKLVMYCDACIIGTSFICTNAIVK